ncbi:hypothetical protein [Allorhizocola rhizosphaerae]|uniref:hypothetical protein n=1 Tax=Allorhizocola rhizosphaerae TaxID=1872709 RepID=UPI000E3CEABF|nr:hypothetical protein [Allorhizocola rhizosphaerae]
MLTTRRVLSWTGTVLATAAMAVAVQAAPAQADGTVTCPNGHEVATYSPGLTLTLRNVAVHAEGTIGACVDVSGDSPARANGEISFSGNGQLSCVAGNASGTGRVNWNPSGIPTTHFTWTGAVGLRPGGYAVLVLTGTVTSNDFQGQTLQMEFVLSTTAEQSAQCTTTDGMESNSGVLALFTIV